MAKWFMKSKKYVFGSLSEIETEAAGSVLAGLAKGVFCIDGDLGSGKTVLARGIAKGMGIKDYITSPTFNIINVYESNDLIFNHMDAYRITDIDMLYDIGFDEMIAEGDITVIEWSGMIADAIYEYGIMVEILKGKSEEKRIIILESSSEIIDEFIRRVK